MVKKWIKRMGLLAGCILVYALPVHAAGAAVPPAENEDEAPVYEAKETILLEAKDNEASLRLKLSGAGVSDNEASYYDVIHSMQLSLEVDPEQGAVSQEHISFEFDQGITSDVQEYSYQEETGILNIYISGQQDLYKVGKDNQLAIGTVILDKSAGEGTAVSVRVVEESLQTVNAAYSMQREAPGIDPQSVRLEVKKSAQPSKPADPAAKKEQKMTVKPVSLTFTKGGKAQTLQVSNAQGKVKYSVDKPKVVSVNSKGKVTPKTIGKATITITAAGNSTYKAKTIKVKVTVKPKKPARVTNVKVTAKGKKGRMRVSWNKTAATGFQIRFGTESTMKQYMTVNVAKGTVKAKNIKNVTSRKYAYVQVRAYTTKKGVTTYGQWSKMTVSDRKIK